ncbi:MAG: MFS transporter [Gammaproteobacteria bacterium]|nr:MFS transporter [Gammaproteobacteria bacterium]MDE0451846.1 MFS transporter [Gammaproteobacteria bacterium]
MRRPAEPSFLRPRGGCSLNNARRFSYAVGDFGINLYFMSAMAFLLFFYTDVYGLSAAVAGGVFLVARIVDAVTDPVMGFIADRTHSRWGKFRPYLLFGPLPLGLITVAMFTVPGFGDFGKLVWAYATYVLFGIAHTVVTIPYASMTAVLTDDYQERTRLTTWRIGCAVAGGTVVTVGLGELSDWLGGGVDRFQVTMIAFSVVATALLWISFAGTEERFAPRAAQRLSLAKVTRALVANPPLIVVVALFTLGMLALTVRLTAAPYYFTYNMGRADLLGLYFGVTMPILLLGLIAVPWLSRRFGKAGGVRVGAVVAMIGAVGFYFTSPDNVPMVFVWGSVMAIGGAPIAVFGWAMIPDTVEYAEWRTGVRAPGLTFAEASFFQKIGKAVGGAGVAGLLAAFGYVANTPQSEGSLTAILWSMSLVPFAIQVLLVVVSLAYRLDEQEHGRIVETLKGRRDPAA